MNYFLLKLDVDSVFVQGSGRPIFAQLLQVLWTFHSKAHYMSGLELSKTQLELVEKLDEIFFCSNEAWTDDLCRALQGPFLLSCC